MPDIVPYPGSISFRPTAGGHGISRAARTRWLFTAALAGFALLCMGISIAQAPAAPHSALLLCLMLRTEAPKPAATLAMLPGRHSLKKPTLWR